MRGLRHFAQRCAAVAVGAVVVKHAAQVLQLDQMRQFAVQSGLDFAGVLPQLRFDVIEAQRAMDVALLKHRGHACALFDRREAVFIEREAVIERAAANGDVVLLASGEVGECKGELRARNGAQIALETALHVHAGLGRAFGDDVHDLRKLHKRLNH